LLHLRGDFRLSTEFRSYLYLRLHLVAIQDGTLTAAHPQAGEVGRKVLENRLLPFRPGAERYYNEIGLAQ
jgi:TRAP-type uncharacterized transport system substrate-binding protein